MENTSVNEGKIAAIISHFWVIGLVIAFVMNMNKKNYFTSFYIRQMVGLNIFQFLNGAIIYKYFSTSGSWLIGVLIFILWMHCIFTIFRLVGKTCFCRIFVFY